MGNRNQVADTNAMRTRCCNGTRYCCPYCRLLRDIVTSAATFAVVVLPTPTRCGPMQICGPLVADTGTTDTQRAHARWDNCGSHSRSPVGTHVHSTATTNAADNDLFTVYSARHVGWSPADATHPPKNALSAPHTISIIQVADINTTYDTKIFKPNTPARAAAATAAAAAHRQRHTPSRTRRQVNPQLHTRTHTHPGRLGAAAAKHALPRQTREPASISYTEITTAAA